MGDPKNISNFSPANLPINLPDSGTITPTPNNISSLNSEITEMDKYFK